ncbi:MAG: family 1 encapsulin nanocompartment shell protein [Anaerolineae bacterium]
MTGYLMRDQAPLQASEWQALDDIIVRVARQRLVARRFLSLFGPVGAGQQSYGVDRYSDGSGGQIALLDAEERDIVTAQQRRLLPLPILYRDLRLHWRDLETSRALGQPLETTSAAIAAASVAENEDRLILNGRSDLQQEGFLNAEGRVRLPLGSWEQMGGAFAAVVNAVQSLGGGGFPGPYAVVVPPALYALLNRVYDNTGMLELQQVQALARVGVYVSPVLPAAVAVVVAPGPENMDILVAQDLTIAYLETTGMDHILRVFECLALRIKRPGAIAVLGQA